MLELRKESAGDRDTMEASIIVQIKNYMLFFFLIHHYAYGKAGLFGNGLISLKGWRPWKSLFLQLMLIYSFGCSVPLKIRSHT